MDVLRAREVPLTSEYDIARARQMVRAWALEISLGLVDQTKIVTAASELARNTVVHGGGGAMFLELISSEQRKGLRLTFKDNGPGIPDIQVAMEDGYTTGGGLGLGLSGAKRLVNEFVIKSAEGEGTEVILIKWKLVTHD